MEELISIGVSVVGAGVVFGAMILAKKYNIPVEEKMVREAVTYAENFAKKKLKGGEGKMRGFEKKRVAKNYINANYPHSIANMDSEIDRVVTELF